jgi:hypothetical protein
LADDLWTAGVRPTKYWEIVEDATKRLLAGEEAVRDLDVLRGFMHDLAARIDEAMKYLKFIAAGALAGLAEELAEIGRIAKASAE